MLYFPLTTRDWDDIHRLISSAEVSYDCVSVPSTHESKDLIITETSPYKSYPRFASNRGNLGLVLNDKKWKFLHKIICFCDLLESPHRAEAILIGSHTI